MTAPSTLARNASLDDVVQILRDQQPRRYDVVVPATAIRVERGNVVLAGSGVELTDDGVTTTDGVYVPTAICDEGIASKLDIPPSYLARMRAKRIDLYDENVNGWLHGIETLVDDEDEPGKVRYLPAVPDPRSFLVRTFRNQDGSAGVARAFLSNSYKPIENLDVLFTCLEAIGQAGIQVEVKNASLTDRNMYVKILVPSISALAPGLLRNYRSPFSGASGADNPLVFAGVVIGNSEVGHGAFGITPYIEVQVCSNGMRITREAIRAQHLGGKLPAGEIVWSDDTQAKNLALIGAKTADAMRTFLSQEWLDRKVAEMEQAAGVEIKKPEETIKQVTSALRYSQAQQDSILRMFIKGGDTSAAGVMQAVTAAAQEVDDADVAADMESDALRVLELAVQHAG